MRKACLILVLLVGFLAFSTASVLAVDSSNGRVDGVCPPTVVRACLEQQCPGNPNDADCVARCNDQCTNMLIEAPVPKWQFPNFQTWSDDVQQDDPSITNINNRSITDTVFSVVSGVGGGPLTRSGENVGTLTPSARNGAISILASSIDSMVTTKPVSGTQFVASTFQKLRVPGAAPVYAVGVGGTGYSALTPVLQLWTLTRNLAYLFFAVAFVVVGIMIIMRKKIDQKNALSIQMALPKIIIALVLVTFSYAIAGFLIDLMYILIGIIFTVLRTLDSSVPNKIDILRESVMNDVIFIAAFKTEVGTIVQQGQNMSGAINGLLDNLAGSQVVSNFLWGAVGGLGAALFMLIVVFAMLWAVFQIWLKLLIAYVRIVIYVIAAPLMLMLDAIPGQNQFGKWLMALLADVLLFPTTIVMLLLGSFLSTSYSSSNGVGFIPPLIGLGNTAVIPTLLGFGILLSIPKVLDELPKMLKVQPNPLGDAWKDAAKWGYNQSPVGDNINTITKARAQKKQADISEVVSGLRGMSTRHKDLLTGTSNLFRLPPDPFYSASSAAAAEAEEKNRRKLKGYLMSAANPQGDKRCPQCGRRNVFYNKTCYNCGHAF